MRYRQIAGIIAVVLVLLFIVQNMATVAIPFLFWSMALPRSVVLLLLFGTGILTGWLWCSYKTHKSAGAGKEDGPPIR